MSSSILKTLIKINMRIFPLNEKINSLKDLKQKEIISQKMI